MKAFEITTKMMVGEDVSEEEKSYAKNYNAKYSIVRHLVMEKMKETKIGLKDFHFTPGEDFMSTPTVDVINSIIETFSVKATPLDFGDSSWINNPPFTGRAKTKLGE
jgi:hypothetical protein